MFKRGETVEYKGEATRTYIDENKQEVDEEIEIEGRFLVIETGSDLSGEYALLQDFRLGELHDANPAHHTYRVRNT